MLCLDTNQHVKPNWDYRRATWVGKSCMGRELHCEKDEQWEQKHDFFVRCFDCRHVQSVLALWWRSGNACIMETNASGIYQEAGVSPG